MIHTIIIFTCTVINSAWGFFWIRQIYKNYRAKVRIQHFELCQSSIRNNICPHDCKVCAWGSFMTERQLNKEKRTKKFYKEIMKYHRRHKHDS